jgi:E3 ubiquitin-protein ligase RNF1/2
MKTKVDASHSPQRDPLHILRDLVTDEFKCAICLHTCTDTNVNPQCGHRFCKVCIKESLTSCNRECPICRARIPTYRTLRQDAQFDRIVSTYTLLLFVGNLIIYPIILKLSTINL